MRVLVCGGRDFADAAMVDRVLNRLHTTYGITVLIHGAARGADSLAATWAQQHAVECRAFPANWFKYGPAAGPIRNQQMLDEAKPGMFVAFPGGSGTADMTRRALAAGVPQHPIPTHAKDTP